LHPRTCASPRARAHTHTRARARTHARTHTHTHTHTSPPSSSSHVVSQIYSRAVTDPTKLNRYKGWSEEVYGEFSSSMISEIVEQVRPTALGLRLCLGLESLGSRGLVKGWLHPHLSVRFNCYWSVKRVRYYLLRVRCALMFTLLCTHFALLTSLCAAIKSHVFTIFSLPQLYPLARVRPLFCRCLSAQAIALSTWAVAWVRLCSRCRPKRCASTRLGWRNKTIRRSMPK
jgi:hypothetical protein